MGGGSSSNYFLAIQFKYRISRISHHKKAPVRRFFSLPGILNICYKYLKKYLQCRSLLSLEKIKILILGEDDFLLKLAIFGESYPKRE